MTPLRLKQEAAGRRVIRVERIRTDKLKSDSVHYAAGGSYLGIIINKAVTGRPIHSFIHSFIHSLSHSLIHSRNQWRRRFVVKYGGRSQSGQAITLFQAPRKISFTFHF